MCTGAEVNKNDGVSLSWKKGDIQHLQRMWLDIICILEPMFQHVLVIAFRYGLAKKLAGWTHPCWPENPKTLPSSSARIPAPE